MARIPYPDPATLPESMQTILASNQSNVGRMLARASEPVFHGFAAFAGAFISGGSPLAPKLREIAILRAGYLCNSAYEIFQHEALALHVGMTKDQIAAVKAGKADAALLGEDGAAVLAFADDLIRNVRASDATLAAVRLHLSDTEVVDLTLVTGMYLMVSRFLETTGIEIDGEPIDWNDMAPNKG